LSCRLCEAQGVVLSFTDVVQFAIPPVDLDWYSMHSATLSRSMIPFSQVLSGPILECYLQINTWMQNDANPDILLVKSFVSDCLFETLAFAGSWCSWCTVWSFNKVENVVRVSSDTSDTSDRLLRHMYSICPLGYLGCWIPAGLAPWQFLQAAGWVAKNHV
jgi:hypothetical protein